MANPVFKGFGGIVAAIDEPRGRKGRSKNGNDGKVKNFDSLFACETASGQATPVTSKNRLWKDVVCTSEWVMAKVDWPPYKEVRTDGDT